MKRQTRPTGYNHNADIQVKVFSCDIQRSMHTHTHTRQRMKVPVLNLRLSSLRIWKIQPIYCFIAVMSVGNGKEREKSSLNRLEFKTKHFTAVGTQTAATTRNATEKKHAAYYGIDIDWGRWCRWINKM